MTATERVRQWRTANPGKRNAAERRRYAADPEKVIGYQRLWVGRNRIKRRAYEKAFRTKKRWSSVRDGSDGSVSFVVTGTAKKVVRHGIIVVVVWAP